MQTMHTATWFVKPVGAGSIYSKRNEISSGLTENFDDCAMLQHKQRFNGTIEIRRQSDPHVRFEKFLHFKKIRLTDWVLVVAEFLCLHGRDLVASV